MKDAHRDVLTEEMNGKLDVILEYVKDIPDMKSDIAGLKSDMSEVKSDIGVIKTVISDHSRDITELKTK